MTWSKTPLILLGCAGVALFETACQVYNFETVNPVAFSQHTQHVVATAASPTTWSYVNGQVVFPPDGDICKQLQDASRTTPVDIQFRILNVL